MTYSAPDPRVLEACWTADDGTTLLIRPIRSEDAAREAAFVRGLSARSRQLRFMDALRELTPAQLVRFTRPDPASEVALVALRRDADGGAEQVAVARFCVEPDGRCCEFAIAVADAWQRRGLGRELLTRLIAIARRGGLEAMTGTVLLENAGMLALARRLGFTVEPLPGEPGLRRVVLRMSTARDGFAALPKSCQNRPNHRGEAMGHVEYSVTDGVAVLAFQLPPVNSLSHALRVDLLAALERAVADPAAGAIVLIGANGTFCAGADIKEFSGTAMWREPHILNLMNALDDAPKPVVAAVEGVALGGGLEFAMACHYRVVHAGAKLGLPEVKLGLLPGAGGTQRLPRLIGVEGALNVMLSGEPLPATLFANTPLIDKLVEKDLRAAAIAFAKDAAAARKADPSKPLPRARDRRIREPNLEALLQFARNTVRTGFKEYPAPLAIVDAVQAAAKLPFDQGMAEERRLFEPLMGSPVSKALRHIFFAERAAQRVEGLPPKTPVREVKSVAIIGAGTMGTGIAINFLNAGIRTLLLEVGQEALDRGVARIREVYVGQVKKGRMDQAKAESRMALLKPTLAYADIAGADLVIEAVFEDMGVKEKVFRQLDATMKPGAILATNTSTLDVDQIAGYTKRPQDVIGLHFFSPANVMKLLEVVRGAKTAPDVLATAMALAKTIRKTAVVSGVCDGFIGNRMLNQYFAQSMQMLDEGASPQQIDAAIERFGFAMGPFRMSDLAGNDISYHIRKRMYAEGKLKTKAVIADKLVEMGRNGQKSGAGWYDYKPGDRGAYPSPVVDKLIADERAAAGTAPRKLAPEEIVDRLVLALVNEGAQILDEKIAQRASDIDLVYLTGYGFPVWRGGPMQYADSLGLFEVVRRMKRLAANPKDIPGFWTPAPLLDRLAAEGGSFNGGAA